MLGERPLAPGEVGNPCLEGLLALQDPLLEPQDLVAAAAHLIRGGGGLRGRARADQRRDAGQRNGTSPTPGPVNGRAGRLCVRPSSDRPRRRGGDAGDCDRDQSLHDHHSPAGP
jgi:hypothetical protein